MTHATVLAAGELLVDLISTELATDLSAAKTFVRVQGGSPANLCLNLARLGHATQLVAAVGRDAMGDFLIDSVAATGLATAGIGRSRQPTTLILVTKSKAVSDFFPYRGADVDITPPLFSTLEIDRLKIFHTTCFALSRAPARQALLEVADRVSSAGGRVSIDLNYATKIWPDRKDAQAVVARYLGIGALVKCSEVDYERLYGTPLSDPGAAIRRFLDLGAHRVVITLGERGSYGNDGAEVLHCPVLPVEVVDTTGAGDAFWSGYLSGYLDGLSVLDCLNAGTRMAAIKLGTIGPLQRRIDRTEIY